MSLDFRLLAEPNGVWGTGCSTRAAVRRSPCRCARPVAPKNVFGDIGYRNTNFVIIFSHVFSLHVTVRIARQRTHAGGPRAERDGTCTRFPHEARACRVVPLAAAAAAPPPRPRPDTHSGMRFDCRTDCAAREPATPGHRHHCTNSCAHDSFNDCAFCARTTAGPHAD